MWEKQSQVNPDFISVSVYIDVHIDGRLNTYRTKLCACMPACHWPHCQNALEVSTCGCQTSPCVSEEDKGPAKTLYHVSGFVNVSTVQSKKHIDRRDLFENNPLRDRVSSSVFTSNAFKSISRLHFPKWEGRTDWSTFLFYLRYSVWTCCWSSYAQSNPISADFANGGQTPSWNRSK